MVFCLALREVEKAKKKEGGGGSKNDNTEDGFGECSLVLLLKDEETVKIMI